MLSVPASAICAALRQRLPGYHTATPDTLQRRFLQTSGVIHTTDDTITVRLDRRAYSPVLRSADLPDTTIPWWQGRRLHLEYAEKYGQTRCAKIGAKQDLEAHRSAVVKATSGPRLRGTGGL